ncbi:MAG: DUF86 domain-containing protein [Clostridia bacterium]|jgi:uncharacterized protein YutE (UPF0331/DUF86 family)|nr:DUF86 domain-containing protein [Clostridia bacterium]
MSKIEWEVFQEKLVALLGYYKELKALEGISWEEYCQNTLYKRTVERLIQLIVEVATDINSMLLKSLDRAPTSDYFSSFIELAEAGVLPTDFALEIAPSTGLGNVIVHEYQKIDDRLVYRSIKETLKYYFQYLQLITDYVTR